MSSHTVPTTETRRKYKCSKHQLQVNATKPATSTNIVQKVLLIEWNLIGEKFINNTSLHDQQENLRIHIFFNKSDKTDLNIEALRESFGSCVTLHESLTDSPAAAWTDLLAYLINFYTKTLISCHHCSVVHPPPKYQVTLVASNENRYDELKALLKSNKAETNIIDGWKTSILDVFHHVCHECKIIFSTKCQAEKHDKQKHNFLCGNKSCERSKRENGFFNYIELSDHETKQRKCEFCTNVVYCDITKFIEHMDDHHIPCSCSCGKYYRDTEEFIQHYCGRFPLPCLENPDCETRFRNIDEQAFHHKTVHGSANPFFCLACYGDAKLVCLRTVEELMSHVSEMNHKESDFNVVIIPDEPEEKHTDL